MMPAITYHDVHFQFKLDGIHLNREQLCSVAYSYIKEGSEHEKPVGAFILDWFDEKNYIEMTTSGSTGIPKIVKINKQAMVNSALATGVFFDLQPGDKALHCLPVKFIAGKMMFVRAFVLGLEIDFVAPSASPLLHLATNYDFAALVPLQAQNSLNFLHRIKKIIIGGAKINKELEKELLKVKSAIYETYGMTETITHIAAKKVGTTTFTTFPKVTVSKDENECLVIHAPRISQEPIVTTDVVAIFSNKKFQWLGRLDNVINSGGIKLMPEVIEEKLSLYIPHRFFVAGKADVTLGEKLILIIESDKYDIEASAFASLEKYEKPKEIHFVKNFKETPTGKVIRKETLLELV